MTEPFELTATKALELINANKLSREEWVESCLKRIKERENKIKAFSFIDFENSIERAKKFDLTNKKYSGIPFAAKDIIDIEGMPTQMGTTFYKDNMPKRDAGSIAIAKHYGCIPIGKTVTTELGHRHPGPTVNPHNFEHTPGGSSSGSAAAVADLMVPIAFGTQTTGSVIRPAAYCGVIGYKPTYGDFDKSGILPNSPSNDTLGLMARSIDDISLMRSILIEEPVNLDEKCNLTNIKFVFLKSPYWEKMEEDSKELLENFFSSLKNNKINITEIDLNELITQSSEIHTRLSGYEFKRSISAERFHHFSELSEILRNGRLSDGDNMTLKDYHQLMDELNKFKLTFENKLSKFDCIITPSALGEALKGLEFTGSAQLNTTWTLLGYPAITLPLFTGKNNMPIGCQFVTKKTKDDLLLSISKKILKDFF